MTMSSGNVGERRQFSGGSGGFGQWPWVADERYEMITWMRGEFAAANMIIDLLCDHMRMLNEPGEYDCVIASIQQRRFNWLPMLHMQQFFPVDVVRCALEQVAWRRQQQQSFDPVRVGSGSREFRRSVSSQNSGVEFRSRDGNSVGSSGSERSARVFNQCEEGRVVDATRKVDHENVAPGEGKKDVAEKTDLDCSLSCSGNSEGTMRRSSEAEASVLDVGPPLNSIVGFCNGIPENHSNSTENHKEKEISTTPTPKTFVGTETFDGKAVNVVDGLKLYEQLFDDTMVLKLISFVNELRSAGKKGQFQGPAFVVSKRPMRGHGREMIQLGLPISEAPPEDENAAGSSKDRRIERIPDLIQDVIDQIIGKQIMPVKPDACIIDFYNEGDYSQPFMWPNWFGRPVCVLFLTECDMTFGRSIESNHTGDYKGSLRLSLEPGSLLAMQGKSTDVAKHAIPSLCKQRILVTFTKSQPRKFMPTDGHRHFSPAPFTPSHWGPPPSRSPNHVRHHTGPKHYAPMPQLSIISSPPSPPPPPIQSQIQPPPNGLHPLYIPTQIPPAMPFVAPVPIPPGSPVWQAARHPTPRPPVPGTGVFLPPSSSGNSSSTSSSPSSIHQVSTTGPETTFLWRWLPSQKKEELDEKLQMQECNGKVATTQEEPQTIDKEMAGKVAKAV